MKTKELIRQLQQADPSGELECFVGNVDIHFVTQEPGYHDGHPHTLIRDARGYPTGIRVGGLGSKVSIFTLDWQSIVVDQPDAPIVDHNGNVIPLYEQKRAEWLREMEEP